MRFNRRTALAILSLCAATVGAASAADRLPQVPGSTGPAAEARPQAAALTERQRNALARQLTTRWSHYVQELYGVPAATWIERMTPSLAKADANNLAHAAQRETFEGAMAALVGSGARLSDEKVIDLLAAADGAPPTTLALGALGSDLVFTPIQPCRILDTRNWPWGALAAGSERSFAAINRDNFVFQGGSATNCGTQALAAGAVVVNLTAVFPETAGYATVFPHDTQMPLAASVNYTAGAIVNNSLTLQIPNPTVGFDFTIFTLARSHYVADIVGYFAPPVATALECVELFGSSVNVPPLGQAPAYAPACPVGFTQVSLHCDTDNYFLSLSGQRASERTCYYRNTTDGPFHYGTASVNCCRVPGR